VSVMWMFTLRDMWSADRGRSLLGLRPAVG